MTRELGKVDFTEGTDIAQIRANSGAPRLRRWRRDHKPFVDGVPKNHRLKDGDEVEYDLEIEHLDAGNAFRAILVEPRSEGVVNSVAVSKKTAVIRGKGGKKYRWDYERKPFADDVAPGTELAAGNKVLFLKDETDAPKIYAVFVSVV